jgi:dipeptidyl-peptidase-4
MRLPFIVTLALASLLAASGCTDAYSTDEVDMAELDIERLFGAPDLDGPSPGGVKISPDSTRVTFLRGKDTDPLQKDLWEFNLEDEAMRLLVDSTALIPGEEELSEEELARRERLRIVGQRGIVNYRFSPDGKRLLFPLGGDLYLYDLDTQQTGRLTETDAGDTDPKFSSTGRYVSFVRDQDLFVIDLESFEERRLTDDGGGLVRNGMAEFIAQEEMDRYTGYWWAPDDSAIAFTRVDESPVQIAERFEIYAEKFEVYEQRYPATGTANVLIRLGLIAPDGSDLRWMDIGDETDIYLPRVDWFPDSDYLAVQRQSRDQQTLDLLKVDAGSGESRVLLTETSDTWINLNNELHFLEDSPRFIWLSDRSGHAHLYLYDNEGRLLHPLTAGDWDVVDGARARSALLHVDEANERIYVTGTLDSPAERNIYVVPLSGAGEPTRISSLPGWHQADFAKSGDFYVDRYNNSDTPTQLSLHRADGSRIAFIEENRLDESHPYHPYIASRPTTEFGTLEAEDGQALYYRMLKPAGFDASKRHPVVVYVYGGPMGQSVTNVWGAGFNEILARNGFIVFTIDNRGTGFRGKAFDDPLYRHMGKVEVADQMVGVDYLRSLDFVDPDRIGIWGWSYGGYMTLMSLFKLPDVFAAGVSGAPVTDWALYDTHYTERYLGTPQNNADGYEASGVFPYAKDLDAPLLLIHGMADDNVLFTNSTKLMKTLQDEGKPFDVMTYRRDDLSGQQTRLDARPLDRETRVRAHPAILRAAPVGARPGRRSLLSRLCRGGRGICLPHGSLRSALLRSTSAPCRRYPSVTWWHDVAGRSAGLSFERRAERSDAGRQNKRRTIRARQGRRARLSSNEFPA